MSLEEFKNKPWSIVHTAYQNSFLHMRPAPEYANGEVVLASTYRHIGFSDIFDSDNKVPTLGREFQKRIEKKMNAKSFSNNNLETSVWKKIITGTLRSPKQPNQTTKRFIQISPVVPDASLYSLSARLAAGSWNPGVLIARIIGFGESSESDAQEICNKLFRALSVDEKDDIWARFLQNEFESWRPNELKDSWKEPRLISRDEAVKNWHISPVATPASQFTKDLIQIISLKNHLTRRQWISMLESILRLGSASHILWVCKVNEICFELLRDALEGRELGTHDQVSQMLTTQKGYWRYGQYSAETITEAVTGFAKARAGINLILYQLQEVGLPALAADCLSNTQKLFDLLTWLGKEEVRTQFNLNQFRTNYQDVIESDPRVVAGKKGISSNVKEFLRHVLGQRQTEESGLDSYDQGYYLAKKSNSKTARWIVSLGPVSVLSIVHACTHSRRGPRTIDNLCEHLAHYGFEINAQEVAGSKLGQTLRNLGLVLDSPDAEGGMVLINPFEMTVTEET